MKPKKFNLNKISKELKKSRKPKDIETFDNFVLRIAKFDGEYHWHKHNKDELFIVLDGRIKIKTRYGNIVLDREEGVKIPKNLEHCPVAINPSVVLMFENSKLKSKTTKFKKAFQTF